MVFDSRHVLTCRHVVEDMKVDEVQTFQQKRFRVGEKSVFVHSRDDVAVIRVDDSRLAPVPGLAFLAPTIGQTVYSFGYPIVPQVRSAYLVMQSGEVTNERVISLEGEELFLYSATARPGDSGGAIVSEDGYVVGMATNLTDGRYAREEVIAPHFAAIPARTIATAVGELDLGVSIPYETFD